MKKKIGIINHWMVNNYGAVLLSYGLEKKLLDMGYDAEVIRWLPDETRYPWKLSLVRKIGVLQYILRLGYFAVFIIPREKSFKSFRKKFLISKEEYKDSSISAIKDKYDKIVIGGDQLWNCKINYLNENNFLPFVKETEKKVVYAASIAQDHIREDFLMRFKEIAGQFSYITTREELSRRLIEEALGKPAPRVIDPAFLLTAEEWRDLEQTPAKREKYIFVYQVQSDVLLIDFARRLSAEKHLKIIYCPFPLKKYIHCTKHPYISVESWIGYMRNAEYIVTDAFHGVVFSVIFNRDFFAEISEYGKDTASRITNILDLFGLSDRLISKNNISKLLNADSIVYDDINTKIIKERENAEMHIRRMLGPVEVKK